MPILSKMYLYICTGNSSKLTINYFIMNEYRVYLNGTELRYRNVDKKTCLRKAKLLAKNKFNYVELVYVHGSGLVTLCEFWN